MISELSFEAGNYDLWIIALNESENQNIDTTHFFNPIFACGDIPATAQFEHMTIKEHKESFFAGASEIHISRVSTWNSSFLANPSNGMKEAFYLEKGEKSKIYDVNGKKEVYRPNDAGKFIAKFTRKAIREKRRVFINWSYYKDWRPSCGSREENYYDLASGVFRNLVKGDILYYVIFEKDAFPYKSSFINNPTPLASTPIAGTRYIGMDIWFLSNHSEYYSGTVRYANQFTSSSSDNAKGKSIINPAIEFKSKLK